MSQSCRKYYCWTCREYLITNGHIPSTQHSFLTGRSTVTYLLQSINTWTKYLDESQPVDVIYLDFTIAFDRNPLRQLCAKLEHIDIRDLLLELISAFLSNRTFSVKSKVFSLWSSEGFIRSPSKICAGAVTIHLHSTYIADLTCLVWSKINILPSTAAKPQGEESTQWFNINSSYFAQLIPTIL